jgi:hypothetical protein
VLELPHSGSSERERERARERERERESESESERERARAKEREELPSFYFSRARTERGSTYFLFSLSHKYIVYLPSWHTTWRRCRFA